MLLPLVKGGGGGKKEGGDVVGVSSVQVGAGPRGWSWLDWAGLDVRARFDFSPLRFWLRFGSGVCWLGRANHIPGDTHPLKRV